jgi:3-hydroxybutyryl-CoA dehydrogenase
MEVKKILIIGAGNLGLRIGLQCAIAGYNVVMYDINEAILLKAKATQAKLLNSLVNQGSVRREWAEHIPNKIAITTDRQSATVKVDVVSESVTENYEVKLKVWSEFAPFFESHTILTTNTSYMLPSFFAEASGAPERFCAWHFHDVFHANVVDIMPHENTRTDICELLMNLSKTLHQTPVYIKKESNGYIFNAMLLAVLGAAGNLLTKEIASIQDIDRSWMGNFKMPIGPFGMIDQIGLDTAWHVVSTLKDEKSQRFAALLQSYIKDGKLGVKTGTGFYEYPYPEFSNFEL